MTMRPEFDAQDQKLLDARIAEWNTRQGPRVGDFVHMPDGTLRRFTHHWGDGLQTTSKSQPGDASFHFFGDCMSFSGSLDPTVPLSKIVATDEIKDGRAWFFHHNEMRAHNGVYFNVPCRVYRVVA